MKKSKNEAAFDRLVSEYSKAAVARAAGIKRQSVGDWKAVPAVHVAKVAANLGIPEQKVRPEPYAVP